MGPGLTTRGAQLQGECRARPDFLLASDHSTGLKPLVYLAWQRDAKGNKRL